MKPDTRMMGRQKQTSSIFHQRVARLTAHARLPAQSGLGNVYDSIQLNLGNLQAIRHFGIKVSESAPSANPGVLFADMATRYTQDGRTTFLFGRNLSTERCVLCSRNAPLGCALLPLSNNGVRAWELGAGALLRARLSFMRRPDGSESFTSVHSLCGHKSNRILHAFAEKESTV